METTIIYWGLHGVVLGLFCNCGSKQNPKCFVCVVPAPRRASMPNIARTPSPFCYTTGTSSFLAQRPRACNKPPRESCEFGTAGCPRHPKTTAMFFFMVRGLCLKGGAVMHPKQRAPNKLLSTGRPRVGSLLRRNFPSLPTCHRTPALCKGLRGIADPAQSLMITIAATTMATLRRKVEVLGFRVYLGFRVWGSVIMEQGGLE